jgi:multidrug efflux pump subunit AcrA (membrane-fusion protein)
MAMKYQRRLRSSALVAAALGLSLAVSLSVRPAVSRAGDAERRVAGGAAKDAPAAGDKGADSQSNETAKDKSGTAERKEVSLTPEAMRRYGVTVGTAAKQKLISHVVVPAQVSFNTQAMAVCGCPVQGRVTELKANVGDVVKTGDELLAVESPELGEAQSDYLQKRVGVTAAAGSVEPAKSAYERAKSLYEKSQGIALTELQKREVDVKTAENALLVAQSAMKAAESRLKLLGMDKAAIDLLVQSGEINPRYSVRAPLDGTVTERLVTLGELVKPDREKLLVVADMTTLWVIADVPETRVIEIKAGTRASVSVAGQNFDGTVSQIGLSVDPSTRSVPVRIEVKSQPALKPGMFAQADIVSRAGDEPVVTVPASAIQSIGGSTAVFLPVDGKPGTFSRRVVEIGDTAGGMVSITSGLNAGEHVVVSGAFILKAELGKASAKDED